MKGRLNKAGNKEAVKANRVTKIREREGGRERESEEVSERGGPFWADL